MEELYRKQVVTTSITYIKVYQAEPEHQDSGNFTMKRKEFNRLTANDYLKLVILDNDSNEITTITFSYEELCTRTVERACGEEFIVIKYIPHSGW
jgi:hypothetical protein